jgi:polar amino acid transport system permease protein
LIELILSSAPLLGRGLFVTLMVSGCVLLLGSVIGAGGGLGLLYGGRPLRLAIRFYVDTLRGIPQLVLIFAIFYGFPAIGLQVSAVLAGILALSLFCGAHVAEVVRGAVASIPRGQTDAALGLGLNFRQRLRHVILPQAVGRILPAWVNTAVEIIKSSSLVSLVSVVDLTMAVQQIVGRTREALLFYAVAAALYFLLNFTLSMAGQRLERRFSHG